MSPSLTHAVIRILEGRHCTLAITFKLKKIIIELSVTVNLSKVVL